MRGTLLLSVATILVSAPIFGQDPVPQRVPKTAPAKAQQPPIQALVVYRESSIPPEIVRDIASAVENSLGFAGAQEESRAMPFHTAEAHSLFVQRLGQYLPSLAPGQRAVITVTVAPREGGSPGSAWRPNCQGWSCPWRCDAVSCPAGSKLLSCCAECNNVRACCTYTCIREHTSRPFFAGRQSQEPGRVAVELLCLIVNGGAGEAELAALEATGFALWEKALPPGSSGTQVVVWGTR